MRGASAWHERRRPPRWRHQDGPRARQAKAQSSAESTCRIILASLVVVGPRVHLRNARPSERLANVGTAAWCSLAHDNPAKWAALLDGARHWALQLELNQQARAEASRAVAGAADWPKVGRELQRLSEFRRTAPWSKRVSR